MLILTNIKKELEFEISRINERMFLEANIENVIYKGTEASVPCNYYVVESSDNNIINMNNVMRSRIIVFEIIYETGVTYAESNIDDLILSFGSKKSIDMINKREINGRLKKTTGARFTSKTQILPPINEDAKDIREYFTLENMFPKDVLGNFSEIDMDSIALHPDLINFKQNIKYKKHFLLVDCIIKLMEKKYITSDCLSDTEYSSFFKTIKEEVEGRRLTPLCRDRLAILCYILLLEVEGFSVSYRSLPNFKFSKEKIINMFKSIGCSFSPAKGIFKLVGKPRHLFIRF